jgi:aspartyl-tRNA(Asn)/glutamyl-tRNA(Gln) amidotransferase subunit A
MLENFVAPYDAFVVEGLKNAGTVLVGKTNMDEFAMGSSNGDIVFRHRQEPVERRRTFRAAAPGGSAAAIAARLVSGSTGTDTGGSIGSRRRYPAFAGSNPRTAAVLRYGLIAFASSLDTPGPFARTAEDCALLLNGDGRTRRPRFDVARASARGLHARSGATADGLRIGLPTRVFR